MQTHNLKLRVLWTEWNPFAEEDENDIEERSLVSNQYHPENIFFAEEFGKLVSSLEEKYNITLDHGGDDVFYELTLADEVEDDSAEEIANKVLVELEKYLES